MPSLTLVFTALGLAADCFAVSVSGSIAGNYTRAQILRTAFAFGLAQFTMPLAGWLAGREIVDLISAYDHWVAFGLLTLVGVHMLRESTSAEHNGQPSTDITRGARLIVLALATSIDALAVGLSFALLEAPILLSAGVIGGVAFGVTIAGLALGAKLGGIAGRRAHLVGGLILIAIGIKIVLEHTVL